MSESWALEKKEKTQKADLVVMKPVVKETQYPAVEATNEENEFKPFICEGRVSLVGMDGSSSIKILRDTGASQSLLVKDVLPLNEQPFTGSSVLIQGIKSGVASVPLYIVDLQSSLVSGPVMVRIVAFSQSMESPPILGNNLAGDHVMADPCVSPKPCLSVVSDDSGIEMSEDFLACAVTLAMAKQIEAEKSTMVPVSSSESPISGSENQMSCDVQQLPEMGSDLPSDENSDAGPLLTREQLIKDQQTDPELRAIAQHAGEEHEVR